MAVRDSYKKRSMAELELAALKALAEYNGNPVGCGTLGDRMFHDQDCYIKGSAPYARLAGRVVRRLKESGEAEYVFRSDWGGWVITSKGRKRLKT